MVTTYKPSADMAYSRMTHRRRYSITGCLTHVAISSWRRSAAGSLAPWQCKKQQIGASRKECHLRCKRTSYLVSVTLDDSVKSTDDPFSPRM